jgi:uncharacterized membrane protein YcgQ (UPF0703/DUF1980 family)
MGTHVHTHDHHHHGDEENSYYLDQICMVTLSAAFGGICLLLHFWNTKMLKDMLAPQFHPFVLISGVTLVLLAGVRAYGLWMQVAEEKAHGHGHAHDHEHCHDHDRGPGCDHDHVHGDAHAHHHHDHAAEDHDHGWAPWRYVVLLVPVIFFLLGLPNKGRTVESRDAEFTKDVVAEAVGLIAPGSLGWSQLVYAGYLARDQVSGVSEPWDFKNLAEAVSKAAFSPDEYVRAQWKDKVISVRGQFAPSRLSDREFRLVRIRISCCANDATELGLPIVSRESITGIAPNTWVQVTGRVEFRKRGDGVVPIMVVAGKQAVQPCPPDSNPYIQ